MKDHCYENFPLKIVFISNLVSLSIYLIGFYLIYSVGWIFGIIYLFYCLFLEIRILKNSCVNCYYYDKVCAFGKGKLSALLFKKGDSSAFSQLDLGWEDMIPDLMVFILPLIAGILILISRFSWLILSLMVLIVILSTAGNAIIRGSLACNYCKQRELGCPAEKLFQEEN